MLNKRCQKILKYLLMEDQPVSIETLSRIFSVSERSIQGDMKCIKDWLIQNKLPPVLVMHGKGVSVTDRREDILACLNAEGSDSWELSAEDRTPAIVGQLLFWGTASTNSIAAMLGTSTSTTTKDMRAVKKWMIRHGVNIVSRPHHGTFIKDREATIRRGCFVLLKELLAESDYSPKSLIMSGFAELETLLHSYRLDNVAYEVRALRTRVTAMVTQLQDLFGFRLTDDGFCDVFLHSLISAIRLHGGHPIDTRVADAPIPAQMRRGEELIARALSEHLSCAEADERELSWQVLCWYSADRYAAKQDSLILERSIGEEFFRSVQPALQKPLAWTSELEADLNTQLERFFCRQVLCLNDQRPAAADNAAEMETDELYHIVCEALQTLAARHLESVFRMDEYAAGSIVSILKFYLSTEVCDLSKRVAVVHDGTVSDAYNLQLRLRKVFSNVDSLRILSYNEFLSQGSPECDILLSTVPLPLDEGQYHLISASLPIKDILQLIGNLPLRVQGVDERLIVSQTVGAMMNTRSIQPQQKLMLLVEIARVLRSGTPYRNETSHLSRALQPSLIRTRLNVRNGDEAIQAAGNLLIQRGLINQSHVNEMLYFNKEYNGYSVIDDGVAMPHLMTSDVSAPCVSLVTLQKPVAMRHGGNRLVSLVIMLVTNNDKTHLSIIEELVALLENSEKKQRLLNAKSVEEVRQIISTTH